MEQTGIDFKQQKIYKMKVTTETNEAGITVLADSQNDAGTINTRIEPSEGGLTVTAAHSIGSKIQAIIGNDGIIQVYFNGVLQYAVNATGATLTNN